MTTAYTATTQFGLEEVLADELYQLGAEVDRLGARAVEFRGDQKTLYKAVLWCRTAMRLLRPIAQFHARDERALYREVGRLDWLEYLPDPDQTFAITAVVNKSSFEHSLFVAQLAKDAVVDQLRDRTGRRPSVDVRRPDVRLHLRMLENEVTLSLDAAGDSLHRRGYRQGTNEAPLNEVLAAGLVYLSGWDLKKPLLDPFCGSATVLTEAGLMAQRVAPGLFHRGKFGFENWPDFDPALWRQVRQHAESVRLAEPQAYLAGSDLDPRTLELARQNVSAAGLDDCIRLAVRDARDAAPPADQPPGLLITNPPYGERLGDEAEMATLYASFGDALKTRFQGWEAYVLSGNLEAAKRIGLRPAGRLPLYNGPIECRFLKFELYEGSRR